MQKLTSLPEDRFFPSVYELKEPLSPHEAAKRENITIDRKKFILPKTDKTLIVEGAGGVMVPLNADYLMIDLIKDLGLPVILVCRSGLGTINHSLLTIEALRLRKIPIEGIIINGKKSLHNKQAIEEYGKVKIIAELDYINNLNRKELLRQ